MTQGEAKAQGEGSGYGSVDQPARSEQPRRQCWTVSCSVCQIELFSTAAPMVYLVLYCVYDILAAKSAMSNGGFYKFEPTCVILCVEFGKLLVTLCLLAFWRPQLPSTTKFLKTAGLLTGPAICFTAVNIITLICLAMVSLAHYAVWYQTGIFFNAILWWVAFRRPFGIQRSIAIMLLFVGCALNSIGPEMDFRVEATVLIVVGSAFISAVGCVLNEYFYKQDAALDINLQNAILYTETSICCVLLLLFVHTKRLTSFSHFFEGFHGDCWILISVQIFIGLSVSRILKYASIITKNYVMALHVPIEVVLAHYILGTHLGIFTLCSTVMIGLSTVLYYTAGAQQAVEEKKAPEKGALAKKTESA